MADGEDPRETLGALERRLRDLERELRDGAREDAQGAAPDSSWSGTAAPGPEPEPEPEVPAPQDVPEPEPAPPRPGKDVDALVAETRGRVADLRESLDGLQGASDRLRSVAQDVVADHGRALVRLERATPAVATPPTAAPPPSPPPDGGEPAAEPAGPRRIPWGVIAGLLAAAVAIAALILVLVLDDGDDGPARNATAPAIAATAAAVDAAGGGLSAMPGLQTLDAVTLEREACAGSRPAVITVSSAPNATALTCPGVTPVASATVVARGFVMGRPGRTCVSGTRTAGLRINAGLTARRAAAVAAVPRAKAYVTGLEFDQRHGLRHLSAAEQPGSACIVPTPENLTDGTYPLATRVVVYAAAGHERDADVRRAVSAVQRALGGTPPLRADVLR